MGSKKVIAIISILSIMLIMSVIGIVVVLVASNQNASSGVNVRYTSKNVSVKMSATAYVGDNKYVFKNGEATNLILSKANTSGSLSQTEDVLELTEDNPKIVFEYKFENLSSSKDAEIALNALPAKQSNVEVSYAFYDDKVNELDSLVTSENFDIQILPAYEKQIYRDRYLYIVVEVADLAQDAQFSGDFAWSVIDTVPTLVTLNNPSLAGTDEEVTYAKTLANNVFWEPPSVDVTNKYFAGWYTDEALTIPAQFPTTAEVAQNGVSYYSKYIDGNIPSTNIAYDEESDSYHVVNALDSAFADETLVIPDTYNGDRGVLPITAVMDYEYEDEYSNIYYYGLLSGNTVVEKLYVGNNVKSIYFLTTSSYSSTGYLYGANSTLEFVELGRSITALGGSFYNCSNLATFRFSNCVTAFGIAGYGVSDEHHPELGDTKLTVIQPYNNSNRYVFVSTGTVTALSQISNLDKVTEIGSNPFCGTDIVNLVVPSWIKEIDGGAFVNAKCETITFEEGLVRLGSMDSWGSGYLSPFYYAFSLKSVTFPSSLRILGSSVFYDCSWLTEFTISSNITTIGPYAFYNSGVTSIDIPDTVTTIGDNAFEGINFTSITISKNVTSLGTCAFGSNLTSIKVDSDNPVYASPNNCNAVIDTRTNTLVMGCQNSTIPDSVKIIGDYAFYNCRNLTNILLPSGLTTIGKDAFYYTGITSITIPASVTEIGRWAFSSCSSLTKTNYLGTLKDWVSIDFKGNYSDYSNPIYYSKNLYINSVLITSITAEDLQGVTSIGNSAFNNCQSLTSVVLPSSITNIGSSAFYGCKNLTSFTIPSSVTNIGQYAFYNCTGLLSTNGGAGITFEGSTTWEKANNSTFTSYLSTVDVTNANQNATWLVSTNKYYNYYWRKA